MQKISINLRKFLTWSSKMAGKPITFLLAWTFVMIWVLVGLIFGLTDMWLLIINTIATINASLMVFIIQNTQNRESKALHLKIDGLIKYTREAERELIAIEEKEEAEIEKIKDQIFKIKSKHKT